MAVDNVDKFFGAAVFPHLRVFLFLLFLFIFLIYKNIKKIINSCR